MDKVGPNQSHSGTPELAHYNNMENIEIAVLFFQISSRKHWERIPLAEAA